MHQTKNQKKCFQMEDFLNCSEFVRRLYLTKIDVSKIVSFYSRRSLPKLQPLQHYRKLAPLTVGAIGTIKSCGEPGRQADRQLWRDTHILLVSSSEAFLSRGCSLFRTGTFPRTLKWGFSHFSSTKINKQRLSEGGSPRLLSDVLKGLSPIAFHSAKNAVFNSQKNRSVGFRRLIFEEPTTRSAQTGPGSAPSPD